MKIQDTFKALRIVFSQPRYIAVGLVFAILVFVFNSVITNLPLLFNAFSFDLLWNLILGIRQSMAVYAIVSMFVLSILGGIVISMTVYLIRRQIAFNAGSGSGGILMSILAPSCSACALGVLGLLGIGGVLALLPFHGSEFSVLALALLLWAIMHLGKKIMTVTCKV